jgi:RNA polymerase sigma factor (sigma-70 family)
MARLRIALGADGLATDADLMAAFVRDRDDAAFAELVRRHGPAVLAEARRVLFDPATTDDVFQATFLVLARRAEEIADPTRLEGWLRGVARRVARTARRRAAKRAAIERPLESVPEPTAEPALPITDLRAVLSEELNRLPRTYREVVVACDVDGLSRRDAAQRLGLPDSTLSNRLTRARALLGRRLLRRGVALGVGLSVSTVAVAVPPRLVALTQTCVCAAAVPPEIAFLATEASKTMIRFHWVLAVLAVVTGAAFTFPLWFPQPDAATVHATPAPVPPGGPAEPTDPTPTKGEIVFAASYSPDGKRFALAQAKNWKGEGEHKITLYDTSNWKVVHKLTGPTAICRGIVFSADGQTVFATCDDGIVYSWDTKTGMAGFEMNAKAGLSGAIVLSPNGKLLATAHQGVNGKAGTSKIQLWDAVTGKPIRSFACTENVFGETLAFTPDGTAVAGAYVSSFGPGYDGVIEWDITTGKELRRIDAVKITAGAAPMLYKITYTRDGKRLIVAGGEAVPIPAAPGSTDLSGYLWVFDRTTGKLEKTLIDRRSDYVRTVLLSPDGQKLYASTYTPPRKVMRNGRIETEVLSEIQCWNTETWEHLWSSEFKPTNHWALVASPDGKRLGASNSSGFYFSDTKTGDPKGGLVKTGIE